MENDDYVCRAVITLADASRHVGSIYQVCNFKYYGITQSAKDFYREDGQKNPRGTSSLWHGAYLPRTQKHRYAYIFDASLKCCYKEEIRPSITSLIDKKNCCNGTNVVYDERYDEYWTCPICTGSLRLCDKDGNLLENSRLSGVKIKEKKEETEQFKRCAWGDILQTMENLKIDNNALKQRIEGTYVSPIITDKPKDDRFEKFDWGI